MQHTCLSLSLSASLSLSLSRSFYFSLSLSLSLSLFLCFTFSFFSPFLCLPFSLSLFLSLLWIITKYGKPLLWFSRTLFNLIHYFFNFNISSSYLFLKKNIIYLLKPHWLFLLNLPFLQLPLRFIKNNSPVNLLFMRVLHFLWAIVYKK
jgi:hypothetical protein